MEKIHACTIEVRGYELDSFGHVNNAVYLNYLEVARWKMLGEAGILHSHIVRDQRWPVITAIEIKYRRPVFMGDTLEIRTRVVEHGRVRFHLEQRMFRGEAEIAIAQVHSVVVDEKGRPVEVPPAYHRLWS